MSRKTKSARGELVDFDLLQVKSKIQEADKPLEVKTREDFVHMKRKRRGSSKITEMIRKESEHADAERQKVLEENRQKARKALAEKEKMKSSSNPTTVEETVTQNEVAPKKAGRKIVKKDTNE